MGIAHLLLLRFRNVTSNRARLFSSAGVVRQPWNRPDGSEFLDGDSDVYRRALKLQRPSTVHCRGVPYNQVSLIGTIDKPLRECKAPIFGVHTPLRVKASGGAYRDFKVLLKFWGEMAEMSVHYLKPDDLIYVSGRLASYLKKTENGESECCYEVVVTEVNFVTRHGLGRADQNLVRQKPIVSAEEIKQMHRDRLHMWHIFFANPYDWWDNRNSKRKPTAPDFRHKDTDEALWLKNTDPPWIRQQLKLLDSRLIKGSPGGTRNARSHLSPLIYNDSQGP